MKNHRTKQFLGEIMKKLLFLSTLLAICTGINGRINQKEYRRLVQQLDQFFPDAFDANEAARYSQATCLEIQSSINDRFGFRSNSGMNCQNTQAAVELARQAYYQQRSAAIAQYLMTIGTETSRQLLADLYARRLI